MKRILLVSALVFAASSTFTETPPPRPVYCDCVGIGINRPEPVRLNHHADFRGRIIQSITEFNFWLYYMRGW